MEKEQALREWCIDRAIALKGGCWDTTTIIDWAKKLEAYISGSEPQSTHCTYLVHSDGSVSRYE